MAGGNYTHYWGPDGFSGMKPGQPLEYASSSVFSERGVGRGDTLYVVTVAQGQLTLLGRFPVSKIVSDSAEASQILGRDAWDGAEHAFAVQGTGSSFDPTRKVPLEVVRKLRFSTPEGVRGLKFKDEFRLDQQTLRGVRQLTPESASLLESLVRNDGSVPALGNERPVDIGQHEERFRESVRRSQRDSSVERRRRLKLASKIPTKAAAVVQVFVRNADVVAEVLSRASGRCERCERAAPFTRRSDGTPYLEVHHRVQLASGGEDTVENALALCPNCHRELHFGEPVP